MLQFVQAGLSLAQGIMGAKSAKRQAKARAKQARAMAKYNASVKRQEAQSIVDTMKFETARAYKDKRKALGEQQVAIGKSGATMSGTGLLLALESAKNIQTDILQARRNRFLQAQSREQSAKLSEYEGELQARSAIAEGRASARSSLLGGISGAAGTFLEYGVPNMPTKKTTKNKFVEKLGSAKFDPFEIVSNPMSKYGF